MRWAAWAVVAACGPGAGDVDPALADRLVRIDPDNPVVGSVLVASVPSRAEDLRRSWAWFVDDVAVPQATSERLQGAFLKGQQVRAEVSIVTTEGVAKGQSDPVTIGNTPPEPGALRVEPLVARAWGVPLVCVPFGRTQDVDDDPLRWSMSWTVDGEPYEGELQTTTWPGDTVPATALRPDQVWTCLSEVTDGTDTMPGEAVSRVIQVGVPPRIGQPVVGDGFTCLLDEERTPFCWGRDGELRQSSPPVDGWYNRLYAGPNLACGLRPEDLGLTCWGSNDSYFSDPPDGAFLDVAIGADHGCGVQVNGELACWGRDIGAPPEGVWRGVAAGAGASCAMDAFGHATCWGYKASGIAPHPDDVFVDIALGLRHGCGLHPDGLVSCWGSDSYGQATPPEGRFAALGARAAETCGLRTNGVVECWGDTPISQAVNGRSLSLNLGIHLCVQDDAGEAVCLRTVAEDGRSGAFGEERPPRETFTALDVGERMICGLDAADKADCIGSYGRLGRPTGALLAVAAGTDVACGIRRANQQAVCWGQVEGTGLTDEPQVALRQLSVGRGWACGLRQDNSEVVCWGDNDAVPPTGSYRDVHVADDYACVLDNAGRATCFGSDDLRSRPPTERIFTRLDLDIEQACGLGPQGDVSCWGRGVPPQPNAGPFVDLSTSKRAVCGLFQGGTTTCWGTGVEGPLSPPAEHPPFVEIDGAGSRQCGLDAGGGLWCWGSIARRPMP